MSRSAGCHLVGKFTTLQINANALDPNSAAAAAAAVFALFRFALQIAEAAAAAEAVRGAEPS